MKIENASVKIGGCDVLSLSQKHGTPLYIMDVETIKSTVSAYKKLHSIYPNSRVAYASKALSLTALYQLLDKEDLFFDVVSDGEFYSLLNAGISPDKAYFHGNNKSDVEIEFALKKKIGCIVVDNKDELRRIDRIYKDNKLNHTVRILLRVIPEIEAHTHEFIQTGQRDTKFGVLQEDLLDVIEYAVSLSYIEFGGIHAHIGSQIFDVEPYRFLLEKFMSIVKKVQDELGITMDEISLGGGIGIQYIVEDDPPSIDDFIEIIANAIKETIDKADSDLRPRITIEPGRSIVANAGVTTYTVGAVKPIPDKRTYVSVNGGMADNPRPITYGADYSADIVNKIDRKKDQLYTIAGKFCESGDILIKDIKLPKTESGDTLMVYGTGAYNYSMASNYNRYRKPAMIFVEDGNDNLVLKRESLDDIIRNDVKL